MEPHTDRPGGRPTARQRWDELVETALRFVRHMWNEAIDRGSPSWPPAWLGFAAAAGILLVLGFVIFPLGTALIGAISGWTGSGVNWLAAWELTEVVTDPVRRYLNEHAGTLPTTPDVLWVAWLAAGIVLLLLSLYGSTGARIGWTLFGVGSGAMVWSETVRPGEWLAVGITAAWWTMLSLLAYRRRAPRDRILVLDSLPTPRRATTTGQDGELVLVDEAALTGALLLLDDLSKVLDTAAQAAMDTNTGDGAPPEAIRDRASQVRMVRRQLRAPVGDPPDGALKPGKWFTDLCWTLNSVPLLDAAQRYRQ